MHTPNFTSSLVSQSEHHSLNIVASGTEEYLVPLKAVDRRKWHYFRIVAHGRASAWSLPLLQLPPNPAELVSLWGFVSRGTNLRVIPFDDEVAAQSRVYSAGLLHPGTVTFSAASAQVRCCFICFDIISL